MSARDGTPPVPAAEPPGDAAHPWADLAPGYAVGALDLDERPAFEAHLAGCARCTADVRAYEEVAAGLARAAAAGPPPAALRARILAEARRPRLVTADDAGAPNGPTGDAPADARPRPRARGGWGARAPWLAAAASLALAAGLGAAWGRERQARRRAETLAVASEAARRTAVRDADQRGAAERDLLRQQLAARDSAVRALAPLADALADPDQQWARLTAGGRVDGRAGAMRLTWSRRQGVVVVTAASLAAPAHGHVYQLWGIARGRTPQSLGTFAPDRDGSLQVVLRVPSGAAMDVGAVTQEPTGGSPRPTTAPLMSGEFGAE